MCRNQTVMSLLYIKSFRCIVLTIIKNTLQFLFVSVLLPSATRLTHAAFQPPEREPAVGVKEGREAPLSTALFSVSLKQ